MRNEKKKWFLSSDEFEVVRKMRGKLVWLSNRRAWEQLGVDVDKQGRVITVPGEEDTVICD